MNGIQQFLAVARGDAPADVLLVGGRIVNVFSGEIESGDLAIFQGRIAGIGRGYSAPRAIDLKGAFVAPGFIDAHVHIESSLCTPAEFAAAILPRGITTAVIDPHEIANVAGVGGVKFMASGGMAGGLRIVTMAPSCVPATTLGTSGSMLGARELAELYRQGIVHGVAEVMNFPAVISGDAEVSEKLAAMPDRPVDGHCPGIRGAALNAYAAAGISSDHESVTAPEAREKLSRGLYLLVREATNARNLEALLPVITPANSRRVCFCSDDRTPTDLLESGSIDSMVRRAIGKGIDPIEAIRMATLNTAERFGLSNVGGIAPGRLADLIVFDDLHAPAARIVFSGGEMVARDGAMIADRQGSSIQPPDSVLGRCEIAWDAVSMKIDARSPRIRIIGAQPDQLITEHQIDDARRIEHQAVADPQRDVLKMAVIERHHGSGNLGMGFIRGFGLRRGAIAGTVAHDHHNLVCIGADDASMMTAAHAAAECGGGLAVAVGENVVARLELPVAGLMSDRPVKEVAAGYRKLVSAARELGSGLNDPMMAMSFMALEVIPALKLTDQGLVDVDRFRKVDLFV